MAFPCRSFDRLCSEVVAVFAAVVLTTGGMAFGADQLPRLQLTTTTSRLDGEKQAVTYWAPSSATEQETPLFVFLHSWSSGYQQDNSKWQREAVERGWIYIHPDFRGPNNSPKACGSHFARQDVLDAIQFAKRKFNVDTDRVYLAGVSGGGHMAMLMAGHHPEQFSAVSAWVGISDLAEWYRFHVKDGKPQKYARMILQSFAKPPGYSSDVDADYNNRSPVHHLHKIGDLPLDIFAGVNDGHTGSVPVSHSLQAFNQVAKAHGNDKVSDNEIEQLRTARRLASPRHSDLEKDATLGRKIFLRRKSNDCRVTIFDGGHESVAGAACEWLTVQRRPTE